MPLERTRLLVINQRLDLSTSIKKLLEQFGGFEVTPFTTTQNALDYAREHHQDAALVDFTIEGVPGIDIVLRLREITPNMAILVTPASAIPNPGILEKFDLQGTVDLPTKIRYLIPQIQQAIIEAQTNLPEKHDSETAPGTATQPMRGGLAEFTGRDLAQADTPSDGTETLDVDMSDIEDNADLEDSPEDAVAFPPIDSDDIIESSEDDSSSRSTFEILAAEEPPMPSIEDSGTVHDLRVSLLDTGMRQVVEILRDNDDLTGPHPLPPDDGDESEVPSLARQILKEASQIIEAIDEEDAVVHSPGDDVAVSSAMDEAVEADEDAVVEDMDVIALPMDETEARELEDQLGSTSRLLDPIPDHDVEAQDVADVAQLALNLTHTSLELAAEAILISDQGRVIATAGDLPEDDVEEIRQMISGDWEAKSGQSRIRFVHLPSVGTDYMLYSRRTENHFTMTMIFAGDLPLRVIRHQSDILLDALSAMPDSLDVAAPDVSSDVAQEPVQTIPPKPPTLPEVPEPSTSTKAPTGGNAIVPAQAQKQPEAVGPLADYTYIWLLRDENQPLDDAVSQTIFAGLDRELTRQSWKIVTLNVHEDYIYLYAQIPGEPAVDEVIDNLKRLSANLAQRKNPRLNANNLWADSYLVLLPGREMEIDEIQAFLNFAR